jgi:hypothetical protein
MVKSGRGGWRRNSGARFGLGTRVAGFDRQSWPPAPAADPRNTSGSATRAVPDEDLARRIDDNHDRNDADPAATAARKKKHGAKKKEIFRRRGAPMSGVVVDKRRGKVTMSKGVFRRLSGGRDDALGRYAKWKAKARALSRFSSRAYKAPTREKRIAVVAMLQAYGVSANNVPHILALTGMYFLGKVKGEDLVAPSTATNWACQEGTVLAMRVSKLLCSAKSPILFFVGTDTTSRGGSIASYIVSFVPEGKLRPEIHFVDFGQPAGSDAPSLADDILAFARRFQGALFAGMSSDAPVTMVGKFNGVGELLSANLERFLRHDTCEHHASACVARVVENMWPPQMNVPSVTQFCYLAWYLLNDNWTKARVLMIDELNKPEAEMDDQVAAMLKREGGAMDVLSIEKLAEILIESRDLNKPDKPNSNRWGTQADMIDFVFRFSPLLAVIFDEIREFGGAGGGVPGSIEAMAGQWIKWHGSNKLRALMAMAHEFLALWRRHDEKISLPGQDIESHCYHKVFSRPLRALSLLLEMQEAQRQFRTFQSFSKMTKHFDGEEEEVKQLYTQLYAMALDRVKRNHGRYLSGVYAYAAFGDPLSAGIAWEAFSHWKKHAKRPLQRTSEGKVLEQWLRDADLSERHQQAIDKLTNKQHLDEAWKLVQPLLSNGGRELSEQQRFDYVASIRRQDNPVSRQLCVWIAALSSTQPVEKTFLDYDNNVSSNSGGKKSKKSAPSGKAPHLGLVTAKVRVARATAEAESVVLESVNEREKAKLKRLQAKRHIISAVEATIRSIMPTQEEIEEARLIVKAAKAQQLTPRGGVSIDNRTMVNNLHAEYNNPNFRPVRKKMNALMEEGRSIDVDIRFTCFPSALCLRRESRKGAPGIMLGCEKCYKRFHKKCLIKAGIIAESMKKDARIVFDCPDCAEGACD